MTELLTILEKFQPIAKSVIDYLSQFRGGKTPKATDYEQQIKDTAPLLTGGLVYLLRFMYERDQGVQTPETYGPVIEFFNRNKSSVDQWDKAAKYGCYYLSAVGL